jgi:hypothetical protein
VLVPPLRQRGDHPIRAASTSSPAPPRRSSGLPPSISPRRRAPTRAIPPSTCRRRSRRVDARSLSRPRRVAQSGDVHVAPAYPPRRSGRSITRWPIVGIAG